MADFRLPVHQHQVKVNGRDYLSDGRGMFVVTNAADITEFQKLGAIRDGGVASVPEWSDATGTALVGPDGNDVKFPSIVLDEGDSIASAISRLGTGGGTLYLNRGVYESPYLLAASQSIIDNIEIVGAGSPQFATDNKSLVGGTIIQGSFFFGGNNRKFKHLGFDSGETVNAAMNGGDPQEGLIGWDSWQTTGIQIAEWAGIVLDDIVVLGEGVNSDFHAILIENYRGGWLRKLRTRLNGAGTVIKSRMLKISDVEGRGHYKYGLLAKSEAYQAATDLDIEDLRFFNLAVAEPTVTNGAHYDTSGFVVQASTADAERINVRGITARGVINPVFVQGLTTYKCSRIIVGDVDSERSYAGVVSTSNLVEKSSFHRIVSRVSGNGIVIGADSTGTTFYGIDQSDPNGYAFDNSGVGTRVIDGSCVNPNGGLARGLAGDITLIDVRYSSASGYARETESGGTVTDTLPALVEDSNGRVVLGGGGSENNAMFTLRYDPLTRNGLTIDNTGAVTAYSVQFYNDNGRVGIISTDGSATTYATSSDYRLKEIDGALGQALQKILALPVHSGRWKSAPTDAPEAMMLAHEVQQVVPGAVVGEKDGEEMQAVDYSKLVPIMWAAIQELTAR